MESKQLSLLDFAEEVRKIPLTQGKVAIVSACDYAWLNQWKWYARRDKNDYYAQRNSPPDSAGKRIPVLMHRLVLGVSGSVEVDHIDGDGLNNCRSNLRTCSKAENQHNRQPYPETSSQYKGVSWNKEARKWTAYITCAGKRFFLGYFRDENRAALAYNSAALDLFGEFAHLNHVTGDAK